MRNSLPPKKTKGRTFVRPLLVTRFIRLHRGAQKGGATNLGSLFEPHHEQNLSANPKRTAKSFVSRNQTVHGLNMFKIKLKIYGVFTPYGNLNFQRNQNKISPNHSTITSIKPEVAENFSLRTRLDHPGQRRLPVLKNGFPQRRFLPGARCQNPDLMRRRQGRITERDPVRRRLGRIFYRAKDGLVGNCPVRFVGKK
jgi:hypothetical protein